MYMYYTHTHGEVFLDLTTSAVRPASTGYRYLPPALLLRAQCQTQHTTTMAVANRTMNPVPPPEMPIMAVWERRTERKREVNDLEGLHKYLLPLTYTLLDHDMRYRCRL